jgi:hypothetical protein
LGLQEFWAFWIPAFRVISFRIVPDTRNTNHILKS